MRELQVRWRERSGGRSHPATRSRSRTVLAGVRSPAGMMSRRNLFCRMTGSRCTRYSRVLVSMTSVTGPSLTRATCIIAPKRPVATGRPSAAVAWATNFS